MNKKSVLYQLMDLRINGIMNEIVMADEVYQELRRRSDECSSKLDSLHLPKETMDMIDRYVSEEIAVGSRYGMLAYTLGFSDCRELLLGSSHIPTVQSVRS